MSRKAGSKRDRDGKLTVVTARRQFGPYEMSDLDYRTLLVFWSGYSSTISVFDAGGTEHVFRRGDVLSLTWKPAKR